MDKLFRAPDPFSFDGPDVAQRWTRWEKSFRTYFQAAEYKKKPKDIQVAILLNCAGLEAQEVHEQFELTEEEAKDLNVVLKKFETYCHPRKNTVYERYRFWCRNQKGEESIDKWVKDLRTMSTNCEFGDQENSLIRDKIVFGVQDNRTKERMLREVDLDLKKAMEVCRAAEATKVQMREMTQKQEDVGNVHEMKSSTPTHEYGHGSTRSDNFDSHNETNNNFQCFKCKGFGHYSRDCATPSAPSDAPPRGQRNRGRSRNRGNGGGRSRGRGRGRGRGRRHQVNELEEEHGEEYDEHYDDQFQSLTLSSVTVETSERGRAPNRGNQCGRSRGRERAHMGPEEKFEEEFKSLNLDSVAIESVTGSRRNQRFARFRFHNYTRKNYTTGALKIDSGAGLNSMPVKEYKRLYPERFTPDGKPILSYLSQDEETMKTKLKGYSGNYVKHYGKVKLPCEYNNQKFMCSFFLADVDGPPLMGLPTGEALGIIKINTVDVVESEDELEEEEGSVVGENTRYVNRNTPMSERPEITSKADLRVMYPECFEMNKRCFPDFEYNITIDNSVKLSVKPVRRIPLELKDSVHEELQRMVEMGVIVPVKEPTEWVNSMVIQHKPNGNVRICLDPTNLNKAIKREHYPSPHLDDLTHHLKGADTFTKLDAKDGYWKIRLSEASSYLTTFNTPWGRFRYTVLAFGLKMSQDVFQMKQDEAYDDCPDVIDKADDITVYGKGGEKHDEHLHEAMEASRAANITLNYRKIMFKQPAVKFFGNLYTKDGVKPDPEKIQAITDLRRPEDKSELRTFLGMVGYLQQFLPKLSELEKPLRDMDKSHVMFTWDANHQKCFEGIKELVAHAVPLAYYDRKKPVVLQTDYSTKGLGVALVQDGKPIHFGSKTLSPAEANYAPIEGEMLAIVYGVRKFSHYLYGRRFTIDSDHKPLRHVQHKNISMAPPRLKSMLMKLSGYDYEIKYRPGNEMVLPDTMSRLSSTDKHEIPGLSVNIHSLVSVSDERLTSLKEETGKDPTITKVMKNVREGWPASVKKVDREIREFWSLRDDLSVVDGLLLCGSRIVIPSIARKRTLRSIHDGHQGEVKCKLRAKDAVYWPGIYKEIEEMVQTCSACQEFSNAQTKCPMIEVEIPPYPWHTIGADLFQVDGKWYLLVTDCFSKVPFVRPLPNTGASATVRAMKNIMSENGVPVKLISHNGVHFTGGEFKTFAKQYGSEMILSSPRYAKGHALIERHVQTIEKCMMKCKASGRDFDLALLALRTTPLDATLRSPGEILNGRKYRSTLPEIPPRNIARKNKQIRERLQQKQSKSAEYYNRSVKGKDELVVGQSVRLYNLKQKVWEPATVTGLANTPRSYFVQRFDGGAPLRRNRIHIKPTKEKWDLRGVVAPPNTTTKSTRASAPGPKIPDGGETQEPQAQNKRLRRQTEFYQAR